MLKTLHRFILLAVLLSGALHAQETQPTVPLLSLEERTFTSEQKPTATKGVPQDINGNRTIFEAPGRTRPLTVAVYDDDGSGDGGVHNVSNRLLQIPGTQITTLTAEEVGTIDLKKFDLLVFTGGLHRKQSATLGEAGQDAVREYVLGGGRYMGVCAGAYLAMTGPKRLGMMNAKPVFPKRGKGYLDVQLSDAGRKMIANVDEVFKCRYANGPVVEPADRKDLPAYTVLAYFRSDTKLENSSSGKMIDSPAIIASSYGKGRVLTISPHPENTPGLEGLIPRAVLALFP
jgi:glutamine amidotransferase-like uncharacterized protein